VLAVDSHGIRESIKLTDALHWTEDGRHYIASTEFQVGSSGDSFEDAYVHLLDTLFEEALSLAELIETDEAAPNERDEALSLLRRMQRIVEVESELERKREQSALRLSKYRRFARHFHKSPAIRRTRQWQIGPSAPHHSASALSG
jgi:hypothetical protein